MDAAEAVNLLLTPRSGRDPTDAYAALRRYGPILPVSDGYYFVTGYAEVDAILRDPTTETKDHPRMDRTWPADWHDNRALALFADSMLQANPPDHTRMRRLAAGVFTARRVAGLREQIGAQVGELLDGLPPYGTELVTDFANPLPVGVITALLGVPAADRARFRRLATALTAVLEVRWTESDEYLAHQAAVELENYFRHLIARRRAEPADDLVTALAAAHDAAGEQLTADELLGNLALLLVAGFETTTNLLGNAIVLLLRNPGHAERLRAEPAFAEAYVEEVLRFDSPVQLTERYTGRPAEIGGRDVPAGAELVLLLGAANRDPRRFPEPDLFDPDRPANAPLSFGAGAHYCLGAPLARLEARIALPMLVGRFPHLRLAEPPARRHRMNLRGWAAVAVELGSAVPAPRGSVD